MKEFDRPIVLASGSPRRRDLLSGMGCEFKTIVPDVDEHVDLPADQAVVCLAERKARAVAELCADSIVIACDTLVSLNGKALGKPSDAADARRMLRLLSGKAHDVYSGLCVIDSASMRSVLECVHSAVRFRVLTDAEICDYVATGEPMDKAGAYAIQGGARSFVESIHGSFENIMGLPIQRLATILNDF